MAAWGRGLVLAACLALTPAWAQSAPPGNACVNDWAGACRYRAENIALAKLPRADRRVVFIGDSLTEGWPGASAGLFQRGMVNRGIGGQTTVQMRERFAGDVISLKPSVVHIMAGTNDIAGNGGSIGQSKIRANIADMAKQAKAKGVRVVLASTPPAESFSWAPEVKPAGKIRDLNKWLKSHAKRNGYVFADYYAVLATPEGGMVPAYTTDGVHLSAAGYAAIEPVARAAIDKALGK